MKILQINSVCGIGSTGRITTDMHNILITEKYKSYIAYGRGTAINCDNAIRIGSKYDNYTHAVLTRAIDRHGFGSMKATKDFIKKIENIDPDIIHLHNIHGYYINIEVLFSYLKRVNKPVVWSLYDCWSFTGHCSHFEYIGCDKWRTGCFNCEQKISYPASYGIDNSKKNFIDKKTIFSSIEKMIVVTPSKWLNNLAEKSFLGKHKMTMIPNGIDLNVFKPSHSDFRLKYNLQNKFIILGVASGFGEKKGIRYFSELAKRMPSEFTIVMVGVTNKDKKMLPNNIITIPRTSSVKQLAEIYTAADVFINPTLEETQGLTNIEALACGTPVITFNTGGSPECINETCGEVVEKGNLTELYNAVLRIKEKKIDSNDCITRSKIYDQKLTYNAYIEIYNELSSC